MENKTPEEILKLHFSCTCDEIYKSRNITDPNCFICENESELMQIMQEYGKQQYNQGVLDAAENAEVCFTEDCVIVRGDAEVDKDTILKLIKQ